MTCGLLSVQGWPLNKIKNNKERQTKDCYSAANGHLKELAPHRGTKLLLIAFA